jgi:hypothetical protein
MTAFPKKSGIISLYKSDPEASGNPVLLETVNTNSKETAHSPLSAS